MRKIKRVTRSLGIMSLLFFLINNKLVAQARFQADVSITSVTMVAAPSIKAPPKLPNNMPANPRVPAQQVSSPANDVLKCTIIVHNENDDDANQVKLLVVVPVEVSILSVPANATVYKAGGGTSPFAGYMVVNLGNMAVQQNNTVEFTFTKSKYGNKVGAYAYSASPDPNPANNYKDASY